MKQLLKIIMLLLLISQTSNAKDEAILQLDTKGHTGQIKDIIVTKLGDIISASDDKTIRVWDSATGVEKRKILGQIGAGSEGQIFAIALSPNEEFLAVGGMFVGVEKFKKNPHEEIRIYNYQSGRLIKILKSHTNTVKDLSFSKDGKYLISGSLTAKIWSVKRDFRLVDTINFHTNDIYVVKIIKSRSDYFAVTAGFDNKIALYNMQTKDIINSHKLGYKLVFLATSKENIAVCGFGKEIKIYDFNLNPIKTIISETKPTGLAYSPNGKLLIAGRGSTPNNINIYSVNQNYKKIQSFKKHTNLTRSVAFLDNQTAISGGGNNNEIYIWDIQTTQVLKKIEGVGEKVWSVGVKGDRVAWGNKFEPIHVNRRGKFQKSINLKTFQMANSINSKSFKRISVETSHGLSLHHKRGGDYNLADGVLDIKRDDKIEASIVRGATNGLRHNCYGFYKNYIVSGGAGGFLKIYNLKGEEVANLVGHTGEVWSIAIDGDRLVSGSGDQTIRVWDLNKLKMKNEERKIDYKYLKREKEEAEKQTGQKWSIQDVMNFHDRQGKNYYIIPQIQPQLNLFISKTNDWIAWTPKGYYNASKEGVKYIGFHINHGAEHEAEFFTVGDVKRLLYRPDIIAKVLRGEDISKEEEKITTESLLKAREKNLVWIIFSGILIVILIGFFLKQKFRG